MNIVVTKTASKDIVAISEPFKTIIKTKIRELISYPNVANIKKLKNHSPAYRFRIGDYRILFDVEPNQIVISRILHRKEAYK